MGFCAGARGRTLVQGAHSEEQKAHPEAFKPVKTILYHIADSHEWHLWGEGDSSVHLPLPVILLDHGLHVFLSSAFEKGGGIARENDRYYRLYHNRIYRTDASGTLHLDARGQPSNPKPLDLSITKNVVAMLIALLILITLLSAVARSYSKSLIPSGLSGFVEPLVLFVRDEIALPNIGADKHKRFLPYLLTLFFFIWSCNLLGLLPGAANITGNIAVTFTLALIALLVILFSSNKAYWKHIFWMPGVPIPFKILLAPIEVLSIFTKPFALMIRLFANMTGGHIVMLSLVSLIFIFQSIWVSPVSMLLGGFIIVLEFLVAFLQAYVFTILTALFIGLAVQEDHA